MTSMSQYAVMTDFGSTYTKVVCIDIKEHKVLLSEKYPSTVAYDARIGLKQCYDAARKVLGEARFESSVKLSTSSAAGGLRMGVIGLSRTLSLEAGRNAAFGAGAKILKTTSGALSDKDIDELYTLPLEILLFCGGYDNGNASIIEHNAEMIAKSGLHMPIIYAGNSMMAPLVRRLFTLSNKEFYIAPNITPNVGLLDKMQVEAIIRDVFLKRIINMKGLDVVSGMLDKMVMPTPAAVLTAGELLSRGTKTHKGMGDLIILDIGGATTDVHSYSEQISYKGAKIVGSPEPYTKRTVEGDLGMRESANSLCNEVGMERICRETGANEEEIHSVVNNWLNHHQKLAENSLEKKVDLSLARGAVYCSARRHAGHLEHIVGAGVKEVQHGKNLTHVNTIIGTGGPIIYGGEPASILSQALRTERSEPDVLLPESSDFYIDRDYVFFAGGLLREIDEDAAFLMMRNSILPI